MSGALRYLGRVLGFSKAQPPAATTTTLSNAVPRTLTHFAQGDRVLLDGSKLVFLECNAKFEVPKAQLLLNDIIGKSLISSYVRSSKGSLHKVELPSLEEYVTLTPRLVTPVYSSYASTIVSLLDIHPEPYIENQGHATVPQIQILEAGTGHGSLTLHLARAIAAANPPPPTAALPKSRTYSDAKSTTDTTAGEENSASLDNTKAWMSWKASRHAILHTVEAVPSHSSHAEKIVRGFRRGLYWPHVDFYSSDVKSWLEQHSGSYGDEADEFLDHVLLDMPGVHQQLRHVAPAMRDSAKLVVFVPSISQIGECVKVISDQWLPLEMLKVLELGEGISNGRKWDVRFVRPRKGPVSAAQRVKAQEEIDQAGAGEATSDGSDSLGDGPLEPESTREELRADEIERLSASKDQGPVMVCRPMVGERTFGGGFIALFKKVSPGTAALNMEWKQTQTGRPKRRGR